MSQEQLKAQASRLANHLATTYGWKLSHQKSLNALSVTLGARNWNALQARARPTSEDRIDWGHQALARWVNGATSNPLLSLLAKCRHMQYSQLPKLNHRIDRVSCGRVPGGLLALDRSGRISLTEIHREEGSSFAVVSTAGGGKSTVMQELVTDALRRGGAVHSIDPGNAHLKFCQQLQGQHLELMLGRPLGLSPFSQFQGTSFDEELCPLLTDLLLELLTAEGGDQAGMLKPYRDEIAAALKAVWSEKLQRTTFKAVLEVLQHTGPLELQNSVTALQASWPQFEPWLDSSAESLTPIFKNPLVVVDTDDLTKVPKLLNAVVMLLALHSRNALLDMPSALPRLLVIEDAEWYLRSLTCPDFFLQLQADLNHAGAGLGLTSVNLVDDRRTRALTCVVNNSITVFVGQTRREELRLASLSAPWSHIPEFEGCLSSIRAADHEFAVIQYQLSPKLVRVALDAYSVLLHSLNPRDVVRKAGLSHLPAAEQAQQLLRIAEAKR